MEKADRINLLNDLIKTYNKHFKYEGIMPSDEQYLLAELIRSVSFGVNADSENIIKIKIESRHKLLENGYNRNITLNDI